MLRPLFPPPFPVVDYSPPFNIVENCSDPPCFTGVLSKSVEKSQKYTSRRNSSSRRKEVGDTLVGWEVGDTLVGWEVGVTLMNMEVGVTEQC